jgi:hypothetical protein
MAVGIGTGLDLSSLDGIFQKYDDGIKKMLNENDKFEKDTIQMFLDIGSKGVEPLLKTLEKQKEGLSALANADLSGASASFKELANSAKLSLDDINKLIEALKSVGKVELADKKESQEDEQRYKDWLARKHKEEMEQKRVEDEKFKATLETIRKQNEEYKKQDEIRKQAAIDNAKAVASIDAYQEESRAKEKAYSKMINDQYKSEANARAKAESDADKQRYEDWLARKHSEAKEQKRVEDEKFKATVDSINRQTKKFEEAKEREIKAAQEAAQREENYRKTSKGAIEYSRQAKSINDLEKAIKYLEEARKNEDITTKKGRKNYRELTKELENTRKTYDGLTGSIRDSHRGLMDIAGQLARKFAMIFSISQIQGYINKMAQVRGEFELQQRSLQAILQNKQEANQIWEQTIDLAVRSPFRIKELVGYTRQLAAYRIETDKLHDTTKMLADVSAGLGVDMQRLILAYGQVRSAEYLRGTELRQFTEAGIPMLSELAKHLETVKGRSFEVSEVFDMISKRMISFQDVDAVFRKMTQAGGIFYNMQEIQADTLKGQISNLKDSIDVMLNDIGVANEETIKRLVVSTKNLVDNWEKAANVVKTFAAALAVAGINALASSKKMLVWGRLTGIAISNGKQMYSVTQMIGIGFTRLAQGIGSAISGMWKFLALNPWLAFGAVVVGVLAKINKENRAYEQALKKIEDRHLQVFKSLQGISLGFDKAKMEDDENAMRESLAQMISLMEKEYNIKIDVVVGDLNKEQAEQKMEEIKKQLLLINTKTSVFEQAFEGWSLIEDYATKDFEQFGEAAKAMQLQLDNVAQVLAYTMKESKNLSEEQQKAIEVITMGKQKGQSTIEWYETLRKQVDLLTNGFSSLYEEYMTYASGQSSVPRSLAQQFDNAKKLIESYGIDISEAISLSSILDNFDETLAEVEREYDYFKKKLDKKGFNLMPEEDREVVFTAAVNELASQKKWSEFEKEYLMRWLQRDYSFTVTPKVDEGYADNNLLEWQNKYNEKFKNYKGFDTILKKGTKHEAVIKRLNEAYKDQKAIVEQIQKAGTKGAYAGMNLAEEEKKLKQINEQLAWFGVDPSDKGKDKVSERLKNQINLIKEMNREYEKLNKTYSKTASLQKVMKAYEDTAKELGLDTSKMDFSDAGTIASLESLLGKPEYAANKYVVDLQKALDNFKVELGIEAKQGDDKKLVDSVQEFFDHYDLTINLKKLNIPSDLAKSLFNVDYLDLDELKTKVQEQASKFVGTDMEKEYKKFLDKIDEMTRKQIEEDAKEFAKFLKNHLDEIETIQDKGAYNISLADKLFGEGKLTSEQYLSAIRRIISDTNKEIAKINLDKFKDSAIYIKAMGNLAAYSRNEISSMINALKSQLGGNAKNMSVDEIEAYYDAIERLVEQYEKIESPFKKGEINDLIEYLRLSKELNKEKEKENKLIQERNSKMARAEALQGQLENYQSELTFAKESGGDDNTIKFIEEQISKTKALMKANEVGLQETNGELINVTSNIAVISEKVANLGDGMVKSLVVAQKVINEISNIANATTQMFDGIKVAADALGFDTESGGWAKASTAMEMIGGVSSDLTNGLSSLASGNFAGALASVVGVVTKLIKGFSEMHDQDYVDIIEAQAKEVERLGYAYEKLQEVYEEAYSISTLQKANEELKENIELQKKAYDAMITAEEAKKNSDAEQIEVWKRELEKLEGELSELIESTFSKATGGILDDVHNAAMEFTNAWYEAFKETGDGLSGLQENFDEMFMNLAKNQAAMQITNKWIEDWKKALTKYVNDEDTELTVPDIRAWAEEIKASFPSLNEALESLLGIISQGLSEKGTGLTSLQKGIQGITEDQADVIESYLNSIRGYAADQLRVTQNIYNLLSGVHRNASGWLNVKLV